ncbi:hypothetical protein ACFWPU_07395 [Streptomyces sp. NPDC058471]|uniref:hypothetical protein n=1 Tax=Streptomyces sp. NPDC058471 TaxID=3346516 RepID=UPI003652D091
MTIPQERTDLSDVESDDAVAWRGPAFSAPIIEHAHGTADGRKLIRHQTVSSDDYAKRGVQAEAAALAHRKTTATPFGAAPCPRLALVAGPQAAAGSQGPDSDAARSMAALGWCAAFVATVRLAAAGGLRADGSGFRAVDADDRTGRRVKGERVRLLARCGYLARHASGLVVATEDGHEVLRLAKAAGPGVLRDETEVMASVRKARRARQWDSHAGQDAHALPVLPGGGEERRRLAIARKGAERAAVEAEKTRKRTDRGADAAGANPGPPGGPA